VVLIGVDKQGKWHLGEGSNFLLNAENPKLIKLNNKSPEVLPSSNNGQSRGKSLSIQGGAQLTAPGQTKSLAQIDVFFPIIHGTYGEDGSLQGMLELLNVAYVGAGVLGSAVGMDKAIMKRLWQSVGLPIAPYIALTRAKATDKIMQKWAKDLGFNSNKPVFVKPANLGSSVGISKANNLKELKIAVEEAFQYDTKILIEAFVEGREIECSVLGNDRPIASVPGEVNPTHEFYSYEAKYIDEHGALLPV